ncbi:hypothetical protein [Sinorhizobium medicae]|uniref:hypothetical protein n=1 Tax=Sinorhizobium medicae TaxID=110321 RepID=UPI000FD856E7|nr:hypothetical protein [Sinorhizobium medicae]RVJ23445.1 hypothetical protein CN179_24820 [Sinorhizobium medicae]
MSDILKHLIQERAAYWAAQGYRGPAVYRQLAVDPELPENFDSSEAAMVLNLQPSALRERRRLKKPPSYLRVSQNHLIYPKRELFHLLADSFVLPAA